MTIIRHYRSPLGTLAIVSDGERLLRLEFSDMKSHTTEINNTDTANPPAINATRRWLDIYFGGDIPPFMPPIHLEGSTFMLKVWKLLTRIPYGTTTTYGNIAHAISADNEGKPMSAQAVGNAARRNPVAIIIPCHRVVAVDGSLHGYRHGIDRKRWLLNFEMNNYGKKNL